MKKMKNLSKMKSFSGKRVIVRGNYSGVFFGYLVSRENSEAHLRECRRIWCWDGVASISQLATEGTKKPDGCKFTVAVEDIIITDIIEIIPCTDEAVKNLEGVPEWKI